MLDNRHWELPNATGLAFQNFIVSLVALSPWKLCVFGAPFGHFLTLGPIWKDAPRREPSFALLNASKHASSDDFEAFFCLTLDFNIFLQKLQHFDMLRCPSSVNQAPQAEFRCYCKGLSNFNALCQTLTNIVVADPFTLGTSEHRPASSRYIHSHPWWPLLIQLW